MADGLAIAGVCYSSYASHITPHNPFHKLHLKTKWRALKDTVKEKVKKAVGGKKKQIKELKAHNARLEEQMLAAAHQAQVIHKAKEIQTNNLEEQIKEEKAKVEAGRARGAELVQQNKKLEEEVRDQTEASEAKALELSSAVADRAALEQDLTEQYALDVETIAGLREENTSIHGELEKTRKAAEVATAESKQNQDARDEAKGVIAQLKDQVLKADQATQKANSAAKQAKYKVEKAEKDLARQKLAGEALQKQQRDSAVPLREAKADAKEAERNLSMLQGKYDVEASKARAVLKKNEQFASDIESLQKEVESLCAQLAAAKLLPLPTDNACTTAEEQSGTTASKDAEEDKTVDLSYEMPHNVEDINNKEILNEILTDDHRIFSMGNEALLALMDSAPEVPALILHMNEGVEELIGSLLQTNEKRQEETKEELEKKETRATKKDPQPICSPNPRGKVRHDEDLRKSLLKTDMTKAIERSEIKKAVATIHRVTPQATDLTYDDGDFDDYLDVYDDEAQDGETSTSGQLILYRPNNEEWQGILTEETDEANISGEEPFDDVYDDAKKADAEFKAIETGEGDQD